MPERARFTPISPPSGARSAAATPPARQSPDASRQAFVLGQEESGAGPIPRVASRLGFRDFWGALGVRLGLGRSRYRVVPGLYALGSPGTDSPVLVSANYKLSFDALRKELPGIDAWILVLDTKGVNVWCAAGKGSFGNKELEQRLASSRLALVVSHRELILPQLSAPGISAWRLKKSSGWTGRFGPVRAADLPAWLAAGREASPAMRRVTFGLRERLVLIPLEIALVLPWAALLLPGLFLLSALLQLLSGTFSLAAALGTGLRTWLAIAGAFFVGSALVPAALPLIPFRSFALKGGLLGLAYSVLHILAWNTGPLESAAMLFGLPLLAAHAALGFTGSTTFTSLSGVEKEVRALRLPALIILGAAALAELPVLAGWLR